MIKNFNRKCKNICKNKYNIILNYKPYHWCGIW